MNRALRTSLAISLVFVSALSVACKGPLHVDTRSSSSDSPGNNALQQQAVSIIQTNCVSCHSTGSGPDNVFNIADPNHLVGSGLIVPGSPSQSTLYTAISSASMPPGQPLSASDVLTINSWIVAMAPATTTPPTNPLPPGDPNTLPSPGEVTYASLSTNLFVNCTACHLGPGAAKGIDLSSYSAIIASGAIVPSNPGASPAYNDIKSGVMPQGGPIIPAGLQQDLLTWINEGAPDN